MAWFASTIFVSAFLLFFVQPLIARYILPWFGGTPGVWTTCMLFFQVVLLAGYAYAHAVQRWLSPRHQVILHSCLLLLSLWWLPIVPAESWKPVDAANPEWLILGLLATSIGAPYFMLSTTGPLLQAWFAQSYPGRSPYRLYALSNIGSLLALFLFPFVFERYLGTRPQTYFWSAGFALFAGLAVGAGIFLTRRLVSNSGSVSNEPSIAAGGERPTLGRCGLWMMLAAIPSTLLLAVTNHLCHEVATIPFLWIIPLALYLITFIICFDAPRWYQREAWVVALGILTCSVIYAICNPDRIPLLWQLTIYPAYLFVAAMVCHGELVAWKPPVQHLTLYFLMISVGGAIGGVWVALLAPQVFSRYFELHWAVIGVWVIVGIGWYARGDTAGWRRLFAGVIFTCQLFVLGNVFGLSGWGEEGTSNGLHSQLVENSATMTGFAVLWGLFGIAVWEWMGARSARYQAARERGEVPRSALATISTGVGFAGWCVLLLLTAINPRAALEQAWAVGYLVVFAVLVVAILLSKHRDCGRLPASLLGVCSLVALGLAASFLYREAHSPTPGVERLAQLRGFYGLSSVVADRSDSARVGDVRMLKSGRIVHGFQYMGDGYRQVKTAYYGLVGGLGRLMQSLKEERADMNGGAGRELGVIGLGIGTFAVWGEAADRITFYEINPQMDELARRYFTNLSESAAQCRVLLGDGRLLLERQVQDPDFRRYDLLVVDAFSGDTIPRHLLTRESFELYARALKPNGILVVNVTHPYFRLGRVVAANAEALGWEARLVLGQTRNVQDDIAQTDSKYMICSADRTIFEFPRLANTYTDDLGGPPVLWTDDYGSLTQILDLPWFSQ